MIKDFLAFILQEFLHYLPNLIAIKYLTKLLMKQLLFANSIKKNVHFLINIKWFMKIIYIKFLNLEIIKNNKAITL